MSEVSKTQVHYIVMNSQKAPQTVEDGAGSRTGRSLVYEWKETLSSHNDMCQRFEGYRSQYSDKEKDASGVIRTP